MHKVKSKISRSVVVLLVLVLIAAFYGLTIKPKGKLPIHQQLVVSLVAPLQQSFTFIGRSISGLWSGYLNLIGAEKKNRELLRENAFQANELRELRGVRLENARLKTLLGMKMTRGLNGFAAEIIANDLRGDFKTVTINRGLENGVRANMPVLAPEGLVGRVVDASSKNARVLLITDPNNFVDVLIQRSRARALLVGDLIETKLKRPFSLSRLEFLHGTSDIQEGDIVVTSGLDGIYPPDVAVGIVDDVKEEKNGVFKEAKVVPFIDFSNLEEVILVR